MSSWIKFYIKDPRYYRFSSPIKWGHNFTMIDGQIPLLLIKAIFHPDPLNLSIRAIYGKTFQKLFKPYDSGVIFTRTYAGRNLTHLDGIRNFKLFTGYMSIIGVSNHKISNSKINIDSDKRDYSFTNKCENYDIFALATVNKTHLSLKEMDDRTSLNFKRDRITILVNEEKLWNNNKFLTAHYSYVLRKHMMLFIKNAKGNGATIKIVSDSFLNGFIQKGIHLQTTSMMKVMAIEKEVKNAVFNQINLNSFI